MARTQSATVEPQYDMPAPNRRIALGGGLPDLCLPGRIAGRAPPWAFCLEPGRDPVVDPRLVEECLDGDPKLRAACARALDAAGAAIGPGSAAETKALKAILPLVGRAFEECVLVAVIAHVRPLLPLIARYALAKEAARRACPGRFPEEATR